jgi:O-6-methylguanine DNA methyltransferase
LNEKREYKLIGSFHDFGNAMATMNCKRLALARQRLGLRWPSTAFATPHPSKAPEDWRSPKPGGNPDGPLMEMSIATRAGPFRVRYSEKGLAELSFPVGRMSSFHCRRRGNKACCPNSEFRIPNSEIKMPASIRCWHDTAASALKAVLAGRLPEKFPPLDLAGTAFQKRVWNALRKISPGKTKSYGEIARAIGRPKAVRAVGAACGANPIPVLVPCHRVLAANGKLGGFSGGLDWKRELLAREGIKF